MTDLLSFTWYSCLAVLDREMDCYQRSVECHGSQESLERIDARDRRGVVHLRKQNDVLSGNGRVEPPRGENTCATTPGHVVGPWENGTAQGCEYLHDHSSIEEC